MHTHTHTHTTIHPFMLFALQGSWEQGSGRGQREAGSGMVSVARFLIHTHTHTHTHTQLHTQTHTHTRTHTNTHIIMLTEYRVMHIHKYTIHLFSCTRPHAPVIYLLAVVPLANRTYSIPIKWSQGLPQVSIVDTCMHVHIHPHSTILCTIACLMYRAPP